MDLEYDYFKKHISSLPRLSEEEEYDLGLLIQEKKDKKAHKKLVLHNMRLAIKMAHQYRRLWANIMDLVQEASTGLAIAAKKWDPKVGTRFGTYAAYWIKAQLTKFLMVNSRLIHTANTRAGRKIFQTLPQIQRKLLLEGKKPTRELIAKEVNEDEKEVGYVLERLEGKEKSLSTNIEETVSSYDPSPEIIASENETQKLLASIITGFEKTLTEKRDLDIWHEHLLSNEPKSLVELGQKYNVSKQRMGQLADRIKKSFRCYIIEKLGPDTKLSWLFRQD